jgi:hypothetical protein
MRLWILEILTTTTNHNHQNYIIMKTEKLAENLFKFLDRSDLSEIEYFAECLRDISKKHCPQGTLAKICALHLLIEHFAAGAISKSQKDLEIYDDKETKRLIMDLIKYLEDEKNHSEKTFTILTNDIPLF